MPHGIKILILGLASCRMLGERHQRLDTHLVLGILSMLQLCAAMGMGCCRRAYLVDRDQEKVFLLHIWQSAGLCTCVRVHPTSFWNLMSIVFLRVSTAVGITYLCIGYPEISLPQRMLEVCLWNLEVGNNVRHVPEKKHILYFRSKSSFRSVNLFEVYSWYSGWIYVTCAFIGRGILAQVIT